MSSHKNDDHFRAFASRLEEQRQKFADLDDTELLQLQRLQLETLHNLENEFRRVLVHHRWGNGVYKAFIKKICEENGNILTSRPYFRERQNVCIGPISKALEDRDVKALQQFHFNYNFVMFAIKQYRWFPGSKLTRLSKQICAARQEIVILNLPLAISQARIFWSKAPAKSPTTHLTYMDFVQIAADGLISAVDKFVLPSPKKFKDEKQLMQEFRRFRPMTVQRIVGNAIEAFSETLLHFFPKDKRKLYRANKWLAKNSGAASIDLKQLTASVNKDAKGRFIESGARTNPAEIANLIAAADRIVNTESSSPASEEEDDRTNQLESHPDQEDNRPDVRAEQKDMLKCLSESINSLTMCEAKLLKFRVGSSL